MTRTYKYRLIFFAFMSAFLTAATPDYRNTPPEGFVRLTEFIPGILIHPGYHYADNFTGAPLPGYGAPDAWMLEKPALALKRVQETLSQRGLGLLVYDAYRPRRATQGMVAWAKRNDLMQLFTDGYIAKYSGHNHGHTVDLTLVDRSTGTPLDMGTPWDTLNTKSHTNNATGQVLNNRLLLRKVMQEAGFRPYYKEWWHFSMKMDNSKPRDVPYGCFEAREWRWTPPVHWDQAGFTMPQSWSPSACTTD